jgi:hypothetical protein
VTEAVEVQINRAQRRPRFRETLALSAVRLDEHGSVCRDQFVRGERA